jgi:hypothetical protein
MKKILLSIIFSIFILLRLPAIADNSRLMAFGANLGVQAPMDNLTDKAIAGYCIHGLFQYSISQEAAIVFSAGYTRFGTKSTYDGINYNVTDMPVTFGARINLIGEELIPYFGVDIGAHFLTTITDRSRIIAGYKKTTSETRFGLSPYCGVLYRLNNDISFNADLKYNLINDFVHIGVYIGVLYNLK